MRSFRSLRPLSVQFSSVLLLPLLHLSPYRFCPLSCPSLHEMFPLYLIFLKRSLVFTFLFWKYIFYSISLHSSLRKVFFSLLAILCKSAFRWVYLCFSPLPFSYLLFSAICKPSSDNHFAFLHFFFLGMVLITASCTMSLISVHRPSGTLLSDIIPWIYCHFHSIIIRYLI